MSDPRTSLQTLRFVQSLPKRERVPFNEKLTCNDPVAIDLLEKMLVFDPRKRITATESLGHEYVAPYHDPTDEPEAAEKFDWSFNDADLPVDTWKVMMYSEILGESLLLHARSSPPRRALSFRVAYSKPRLPSGWRLTTEQRGPRRCSRRSRGPNRRRGCGRINSALLAHICTFPSLSNFRPLVLSDFLS